MTNTLPLDIKGGTIGKNFFVTEGIDPSRLQLQTPDGQIKITIPKDAWPFLKPNDGVLLFLNVCRVGLAEPTAEPLITLPGLITDLN